MLLLERDDALGTGSTGRCAGGFRHQFSSRVNIELSLASVPMITSFPETHGLPLDVHRDGYLFLVRSAEDWEGYVQSAALQRSYGIDARLLSPEEAVALAPGISTEGLVGATYCPDDGIADPSGLTLGYATAARRAGARIETGVEVRSVDVRDGRVTGVDTSNGTISAGAVVNAAGPWAARLAATAGVDLPVEPVPRHVVVTGAFPGVPERRTLVIDAGTTFYFHREGQGVLMGMGSPTERPSFELRVDEAFVADELLPTALAVFPPLERAALAQGVGGFYLANGFSGHGFQHAPVVGKLLAEMIVEGGARTVDVAALGLERFADGSLAREARVV